MHDRIPITPPKILPVHNEAKRPLWSIMIPTYNCSDYLRTTLNSVLEQDQGPERMQIEVVDDCSTDSDVEFLVKNIGKGRITYFRQPHNVGSLRNFETCLSRSKGFWIHLLHGDDGVKHGFYQEIENLFQTFPEAVAAFTNHCLIDENGLQLNTTSEKLADRNCILEDFICKIAKRQLLQPPAIVVHRKVYEKIGSFYAVCYGEDWEMWSRIAAKFPIAYSPKILADYRVGNKNSISHQSFISGQNVQDTIKVIKIIQGYVPPEHRRKTERFAKEYYSIYCLKVANSLLTVNSDKALLQAKAALQIGKSLRTYYWAIRFYLMYLTKFKKLQRFLRGV